MRRSFLFVRFSVQNTLIKIPSPGISASRWAASIFISIPASQRAEIYICHGRNFERPPRKIDTRSRILILLGPSSNNDNNKKEKIEGFYSIENVISQLSTVWRELQRVLHDPPAPLSFFPPAIVEVRRVQLPLMEYVMKTSLRLPATPFVYRIFYYRLYYTLRK